MAGTISVDTDVINAALDHLSETPILNAGDSRPEVRFMKRNYRRVVDKALVAHHWNFAKARTLLPETPDHPDIRPFPYAYHIPPDCLRVIPPTVDGKHNGTPIRHVIEGRVIFAERSAPLPLVYLRRAQEYDWSPAFVEYVALALAAAAAHAITAKNSYVETLSALRKESFEEAKVIDGLEGDMEEPYTDAYEMARLGYGEYGV